MMDCVCECKEACCWRFCYFYLKSYALCELGTSIIKRLAANQDELQESVPVALPLVIYKALEKKDENDLLVNVAKTWTKVWIILSTRMCGALLVHKGVQYLKQVPRATATPPARRGACTATPATCPRSCTATQATWPRSCTAATPATCPTSCGLTITLPHQHAPAHKHHQHEL